MDLRPEGAWKPLNMAIRLEPLKGSSEGGGVSYAKATLRVSCPPKYPKLYALRKVFPIGYTNDNFSVL